MQETKHIPDATLELAGVEWGSITGGVLEYDLDLLPEHDRPKARERLSTDPILMAFLESTIVTRLPSSEQKEEAKEEGAVERS